MSSTSTGDPILFTGDRPNGSMHIGHYVGSLRSRLERQGDCRQYIMIADHLALTDNVDDPSKIAENVVEVGLDYLATGLDPKLSTFFVQSDVLELSALTTLYMNLMSAGDLLSNPTKNEEVTRRGFGHDAPAGMFTYSVSQVADITAFDATLVPVGADQVPLVQFAAMLVERFTELFGAAITAPAPLVPTMGRLPGTDGAPKMGKSLGNAIYFSDSKADVETKILSMAMRLRGSTTSTFDETASPPFIYLREFHPSSSEVNRLVDQYTRGSISDDRVRQELLDVLQAFLEPIRIRRAELSADRGFVRDQLKTGGDKARDHAAVTLARVKEAMGLAYR